MALHRYSVRLNHAGEQLSILYFVCCITENNEGTRIPAILLKTNTIMDWREIVARGDFHTMTYYTYKGAFNAFHHRIKKRSFLPPPKKIAWLLQGFFWLVYFIIRGTGPINPLSCGSFWGGLSPECI